MDFGLNPEQRAMLDTVDRLVATHLPPDEVRRRDREYDPPAHLLKAYSEAGLLALPLPPEYGGLGESWTSVTLVHERLGYHAAMAGSLFGTTVGFGSMSVLTYGSEEQKRELLPRIVSGDLRFSLALTEPGAGSDAGALITKARRTDKGWVINGRKTWISDADRADYLLTACRTAPDSKGSAGITMLLVPKGAEGIQMTLLEKIGNNCLTSWDISYDDVLVADDSVLGDVDNGFRNLMSTLHYSRAGQAANSTGQAQRAVDVAVAHAKERVQFDQPIARFQVIQHRLVDMQTRVDQARHVLYHLAWLISEGMRCRKEAAQSKMVATECLQFVTHHGMQILASAGYSAESDMQRLWRDARLYTFGEGSNEIQRDIIAREMGLQV